MIYLRNVLFYILTFFRKDLVFVKDVEQICLDTVRGQTLFCRDYDLNRNVEFILSIETMWVSMGRKKEENKITCRVTLDDYSETNFIGIKIDFR